MKLLKIKLIAFTGFCVFTLSAKTFAQQGSLTVNQDEKITNLLNVKKEMNKDENATDRFKIQIFSITNDRKAADTALNKYDSEFSQWESTLLYETPNFKVWVGSFRTRLEADRALLEIKPNYPNAFILQPKSKS